MIQHKNDRMDKTRKTNFILIGLKLEGKTTNENNLSGRDCGNLWQKFKTDKIFDLIPNKLSKEIYAVYYPDL
jgi:predicted transcriptional regulator YdeE